MIGNPVIRIWLPIYKALKRVSVKRGLAMSDLASLAIIAGMTSPSSYIDLLTQAFDISKEEALEVLNDLTVSVLRELEKEGLRLEAEITVRR